MLSPTASETVSRTRPSSLRLHVVLLAAFVAGCAGTRPNQSPPAPAVRLSNRPPIIQGVLIVAQGQRLRVARMGTTMEIRVLASDPDGDRLRYSFVSTPDTGRVTISGAGRLLWSPPNGIDPARLSIRVGDARGAMVERVLVASPDPRLAFGGRVVDPAGSPIAGVAVTVDGTLTRSDATGRFSLALPDRGQRRFVLNLSHPKYGPASHVTSEPVRSGRWVLADATVIPVDFQKPVTAQVTTGSCATILSSRVNWSTFPRQHAGISVTGRTPVTASIPSELAAALRWAESLTTCPDGFSMRAGANAFIRVGGGAPAIGGQIALTQIPAWGGASMPGDYTARAANGQQRVMESFGAASVRVSSGGEPLQLAPGQKATLRWPVHTTMVRREEKPISELPLLRYDDSTGVWVETGVARLDAASTAWTAEVDHLSTFNLDLLKVNQSCVRIDATALLDPSIALEVTIPQGGSAVVRTTTLDNATAQLHAIYNLPTNTVIALRAFRDVAGAPEPLGTFVVATGDPQTPTDPNEPSYPYEACRGYAALVDLGATVSITEQDNDPMQAGMLVPVYVGLLDRTTEELYPLGDVGRPVVGIYDNGSTSVFITDQAPNRLTGSVTSDATLLGATHGLDVMVRVSPVDMASSPETAPMGGALGGSPQADAELLSVKIRITTSNPSPPDLTLLGAPFAVQHLAWIDYSVGVSIPGSPSGELGAWSRFFASGAAGAPIAEVTLPMTRFGTASSAGTYTSDQRFLVAGVTFYNAGRAVGHAVPGSTDQVWLDVGSTWTAISGAVATALGLRDVDIIGPCFDTGNLFRLDAVEFVGAGGRYTVRDAMVCRHDASMPTALGNPTQAMLGSNLFRRMAIVVDGPNNSLGVLRP